MLHGEVKVNPTEPTGGHTVLQSGSGKVALRAVQMLVPVASSGLTTGRRKSRKYTTQISYKF